jgi:glycosyltransferase involved in cell wall biosynthesis
MSSHTPIHVCHFTSVHPWSDIRILHKECVSLAASGMQVTLIATGANADDFSEQGVNVITMVNTYKGRLNRATQFSREVAMRALDLNADVYHFHDPELLRFVSLFTKRGKKIIYDVHEDLPRQIMTKQWIPFLLRSPLAACVEWIENRFAKKVSAIVCATPHIRNRFSQFHATTEVIFNAPLLREFNFDVQPKYDSRRLIYVGLISRTRGIVELLQALEHINGRLHLAGKFEDEALKNQCEAMPSWSKVDYHGVVGRTEIARLLSESALGMVTLHPTMSYKDSYPIKMFEYMGAGLPVLASDFELWRTMVVVERTGICVDPLDVHMIGRITNEILDDAVESAAMGARGREYVKKRFNWEAEAEKLKSFYSTLFSK